MIKRCSIVRFSLSSFYLSLILAILAMVSGGCGSSLSALLPGKAPDVADYAIQVRLDPETYEVSGTETITYRNTTQIPITDLVFHLYMNAFKSSATIFNMESGMQLRGSRFDRKNPGWIEVSALRIKDGEALNLELLEDGTLAKAALPQPVQPGKQVTLEVAFKTHFPKVYARAGWAKDAKGDLFFLAGQWFPKLGVWTEKGWNAYPYHGNSEFFADFGNYDVQITLPEKYKTGATGMPGETVKNNDGTQTVRYAAKGVIDFAWVASPNLSQAVRKVGKAEILFLYLPEHDWSTERVLTAAADAVQQFGEWYYPYPYPRLTVVDVPEDAAGAGGMEYPSFITTMLFTEGNRETPDSPWKDFPALVTIHETGHQWFQSTLASNEAEEAWLDEGMTEYSTARLFIARYGLDEQQLSQGHFPEGWLAGDYSCFGTNPGLPIEANAWSYKNFVVYDVAVYCKATFSLLTMQRVLGDKTMEKLMRTYATRYRFAHPTTADFQKVATQVSRQDLSWFFGDPDEKTGLLYGNALDSFLNYKAISIQDNKITAARFGKIIIPTEILVTYTDGTQETIPWDGKDKEHTFQLKSPVKSFKIDPQNKLLVDLIFNDNQKP